MACGQIGHPHGTETVLGDRRSRRTPAMSWSMNRRHLGTRLGTAAGAAAFGVAAARPAAAAPFRAGDVYSLTNAPGTNAVAIFARGLDGTLTPDGTAATGGSGTGGGLGTQGALWLN